MAQYYMLNKPRGLLTARRDARCETCLLYTSDAADD